MIDFKDYLADAAEGNLSLHVFILPKSSVRLPTMMRLMDEAHEAGLDPTANRAEAKVRIGPAVAVFHVAWLGIADHLCGLRITKLQAGDAFDALPGGEDILRRIMPYVGR